MSDVRERPHEREQPDSERVTDERVADAPKITIRGAPRSTTRSRLELGLVLTLVVSGLVTFFVSDDPVTRGAALAVGLGALADALFVGPAVLFARAFAVEGARLRAALACPFCKDALPNDAAVACDRAGCGAFYHPECWAECATSYGGCAIYGCGCRTSHPVGRFALRRHVFRLLVATVLFTPKLVKRLQERDRESFRDVWRRAKAYQHGVTYDGWRTTKVAILNFVLSFITIGVVGGTLAFIGEKLHFKVPDKGPLQGLFLLGCLVFISIPPILFMRLPLAAHFGWGAAKVIARVFGDELAALRRADEGTFLARLASGLGKKPG